MGNLAVVEKLDRLLQAICQSLVDRDFRYRAESHCSIFAILLGRIPGDRYRSVSATQPILGAGGPADGRPTMTKAVHCDGDRSEEHTSELQSLMRISYAVFCLKNKKKQK